MGITETHSVNSTLIKDKFETWKSVPLAIGDVTWTPTCHVPIGEPMQILQIINKAEKYITTIKPSWTAPAPC